MLTHGWQSVADHSADALRPLAPDELLRATTTASSTMSACSWASSKLSRCRQCSPHIIALQWYRSADDCAPATCSTACKKRSVAGPTNAPPASNPKLNATNWCVYGTKPASSTASSPAAAHRAYSRTCYGVKSMLVLSTKCLVLVRISKMDTVVHFWHKLLKDP